MQTAHMVTVPLYHRNPPITGLASAPIANPTLTEERLHEAEFRGQHRWATSYKQALERKRLLSDNLILQSQSFTHHPETSERGRPPPPPWVYRGH